MSELVLSRSRLAARLRAQIPADDLVGRQAVAFLLAHLDECAAGSSPALQLQLDEAASRLPSGSPLHQALLTLKDQLPKT